MSGICGIYNYNSKDLISPDLLNKMSSTIKHRGPHFREAYINNNIGLAVQYSRRDVQSGHDGRKNLWCVLDGKIFNKKELCSLIPGENGSLSKKAESEILTMLYDLRGEDFIKLIDGEFAFCLWDGISRKLILARNHSGNKPLYYYQKQDSIIFGSEIKAILADPSIEREIDPISIDAYFTLHDVPCPDTLFKGVKQVPAGSFLICSNDETKIIPYWKYNSKSVDIKLNEKECSESLYSLLAKSVKKRLEGESNAGAFLSSGIDSSVVTFLMKQVLNKKFNVFSVGFDDQEYDELPYAKKTANFLDVQMHDVVVDAEMAKDTLPKIIRHTDLPFYDSSAIPTYYGGLVASKNSDVVFTGDGSDQLLGGSIVYAEWKKQLRLLPEVLRCRVLSPLLKPICTMETNNVLCEKIIRNTKIECLSLYERFSTRKDILPYSKKEKIYNDDFKKQINGDISLAINSKWFSESNRSDFIDQLLYKDVLFFLQDDLLVKVDRMLSASSMEFRTPFLDIEVMDFISTIPLEYKIKGVFNPIKKYILKKTFGKHLPDYVLTNRKTGFEPPYRKWMRNEFKDMILDHVLSSDSSIHTYFDIEFVKKTIEQFYSGKYLQNWRLIWAWFMFEMWHREYICNTEIKVPVL
ncbi:MAG: asparagine synthase (glutamine-hydrolyzing) [Candidatus Omnitrophota bacterium]